MQERNYVAEMIGFFHIVGRHEYGGPKLAAQVLNAAPD
jgi:hypothetical protein